MAKQTYDILLAGGGVMGCAIATYLLRANPMLSIGIIEPDPTYEKASTPLSDGNLRVQFNIRENIQMSLYGLEVLANFGETMAVNGEQPRIDFRQQGNIFIVDDKGRAEAEAGLVLQQSLGCKVEWLEPHQIEQEHPYFCASSWVGGTMGWQDGSMSPLDVLLAYKNKAMSLGADYIVNRVTAVLTNKSAVTGVALASGETLTSAVVVNCAGGWATELAKTAHVQLPIQPVKRQVFVVETSIRPDKILPSLILPTGLYCFHEGAGHFMVGKSFHDDPITTDDFSYDRTLFEERIWEDLVDYLPDFDRLKVVDGWGGLYAVNTFDGNALLGEWPKLKGFYLANGFSGHGFQQCHAVGRYLAELILGQTPMLDLSCFSPLRLLEKRPLFESQHKIV